MWTVYILHRRMYTEGQWAHLNVLNTISYLGNANSGPRDATTVSHD